MEKRQPFSMFAPSFLWLSPSSSLEHIPIAQGPPRQAVSQSWWKTHTASAKVIQATDPNRETPAI